MVPELVESRSVFAGITRVQHGRSLHLSAQGVRQRAWILPRPGALSLETAAPALRSALTAAVHGRVAAVQQPTTDLSGGLDSTTVALLAAQRLRSARGLPAFTYADAIAKTDDDLAYAALAARAEPRLWSVRVRGSSDTLPYRAMRATPMTDQPSAYVVLWSRERACLEAIATRGSDLHLTGNGGDAVLVGPITYLADLARAGQLRMLTRHCTAWARLRQRSPLALMRAATRIASASYPYVLRMLANRLIEASPEPGAAPSLGLERHVDWAEPSAACGWTTVEARRELAACLRTVAEPYPPGLAPGDHGALRVVAAYGADNRAFIQIAEASGVRITSPYLDDRVVRICLAVRAIKRTTPFVLKPLLGAAFRGVVPDAILDRRTKGDYTAARCHGARRNAEALRE